MRQLRPFVLLLLACVLAPAGAIAASAGDPSDPAPTTEPTQPPTAPYYGGLQMDLGFQRTYGRYLLARKGTANHWTPLEQMWVAERALRAGRGFYPWPNTARYCGLI